MPLTDSDKRAIADRLQDTCDTGERLAEEYVVEVEAIGEAAADYGVDLCQGCNWWFEISELDEEYYCGECR